MSYQWISDYCLQKPGAQEEFQTEWQANKLMIDNKMFAFYGQDNVGNDILTLKLSPEHGIAYRELYPDQVIPGYYMNKVHWNTIMLESDISQDFIKECLDEAYQLILASLSKKRQTEILGEK
ncbi:MmcQ/YjbR family DNA-binding protein [Culicoidibacter larvae]|uniref:MmcQ/YjbR family DNA-binding protein n=1 Tax=Culicoidibacter larvae TaxID=2579976 RepID=A0A5R8QA58_9FIRM|nr:MmcQ/YjbR family DNA-binding protein [Culicoidibacter larvae]TLG71532.1 MmcQ/YjbR family DNA-binding protein [Culicoidibacter larvae]